jgi:hypothetical protein
MQDKIGRVGKFDVRMWEDLGHDARFCVEGMTHWNPPGSFAETARKLRLDADLLDRAEALIQAHLEKG